MTETIYVLQILKYVLSGPLQEKSADPWPRARTKTSAAEVTDCSNAKGFYSHSEMEGNAKYWYRFSSTHRLFSKPVFSSYKGLTLPREQKCFACVENCLHYFIFWINNTTHHVQFKMHKMVYSENKSLIPLFPTPSFCYSGDYHYYLVCPFKGSLESVRILIYICLCKLHV